MRQISLQGHRGARGLLAENTLPSLAGAFDYAMQGIEFDIQLTKDDQLVIYHDLTLKSSITRNSKGQWVSKNAPAVRSLTLKQLRKYKIGQINKATAYGLRFRKQGKLEDQCVPTLSELIEYLDKRNLNKVLLNIEIKHSPVKPKLCPEPAYIAQKVADEISSLDLGSRTIVQCFNWSVVEAVKGINNQLLTSCLTTIDPTEDTLSPFKGKASQWNAGLDIRDFNYSVADMVSEFGADYWAPYFRNLKRTQLQRAHQHKLKVMTWTVNHSASMKRLMNWGVDGIISDYPNKLEYSWKQWASKIKNT